MDGATIGDWFVWCVAAHANALVSGSVIVVVSARAMVVVVRWTGHGQRASRGTNTALTVCVEGASTSVSRYTAGVWQATFARRACRACPVAGSSVGVA